MQIAHCSQMSSDNLSNYIKKWKLTVNTQKTKSMVFNCKNPSFTFTLKNQVLQDTNNINFVTLGFLTPSDIFSASQKYLDNQACRALYALRASLKCVTESTLSVNTHFKLFTIIIKVKVKIEVY